MKERKDSGLEGYVKGRIRDCWNSGLKGYRKGGFRTEGMGNRRDAGRQEIFMRGVIQICFSNGAKEQCFCSMLQFRFGFAC